MLNKLLASGGILAVVMVTALLLALFGLTVYGICLAFSAGIVLGFICLFTSPSGLVVALVYLVYNYNIPQHLANYFSNN